MAHGTIPRSRTSPSLTGDSVRFTDGSEVQADVVVYCTGYKVTFPFFDEDFISAPDNDLPLFRRAFHPDIPNVFFIGLLQPLGAIMPLAEAQSEWVADYLRRYALPLAASAARRHGAEREPDVQALRRLQAPHDAGRLRRLHGGDLAEGARGGRGARGARQGTGCRCRRAAGAPVAA